MFVKTGVTLAALEVKAVGPDDGLKEGQFIAYASVFGNVDSYGDIVEPGAFKDTLEEWRTKDGVIPLLWGHDMYDPFNNIGGIDPADAEEDPKGLLVKPQLDLENPTAVQVYRMLKGKRVTDMSFAYTVEAESKKADGNHLEKLGLLEVSVVPIGANRETGILAIKSHLADLGLKAGRVLSAANEKALKDATTKITEALSDIDTVLAAVATEVPGADGPKSGPSSTSATAEASGTSDDKGASSTEDPSATRPGKVGDSPEDQKAGPSVDTYAAVFTTLSWGTPPQEGA